MTIEEIKFELDYRLTTVKSEIKNCALNGKENTDYYDYYEGKVAALEEEQIFLIRVLDLLEK